MLTRMFSSMIAALFAFMLHATAYAGNDSNIDLAVLQKNLGPVIFSEVVKIPDKPHFLRGFERKTDEWEELLEVRRFFRTEYVLNSGYENATVDRSFEGYVQPTGFTAIFRDVGLNDHTVKIIYSPYYTSNEGMHTFWSGTLGEKNLAEFSTLYRKYEIKRGIDEISDSQWRDVKRVLGWAEFEAIHDFVRDMLTEGLEKTVGDYREIVARIPQIRAERLADPEYPNRLNEVIPGTDGLTIGDHLPLPSARYEDSLPDVVVIGAGWFTGGYTNAWKTEKSERVVFLGLRGLALQYITEWPLVSHELTHANPTLQSLPLTYYFDVELFAALTNDLQDDMFSYLLHSYLSNVRHSVLTYFGYDHNEVIRRIFPDAFGPFDDIREAEFREHVKRVEEIREELKRFILDPEDGFLVQFYTDPQYWATVNTKYCDSAAAWNILFGLRYEPAGIFDPEKKDEDGNVIPAPIQTATWIATNKETIKKLAEAALRKTGKESRFAKEAGKTETFEFSKCPVHSRFFLSNMSETERARFVNFVKDVAEQAEGGNWIARAYLMRMFGGSGALAALNQQ